MEYDHWLTILMMPLDLLSVRLHINIL